MEKSVERTQRTVIRFLFGILFGLILLIGTIWGGHDLYVRWQEKRLVRRATFDVEHGDERDASLAARSILQMKPSSASASRIMAELAERAGERAALDWRRMVVELAPHSVDDELALVRCAIQFNDIPTAERTLGAVDENSRNSSGYHEASALVAQSRRQDEKADSEWSEALRLKPDDKSYQLQLGVLRLRANQPERRATGEAMLAALRSDPGKRSAATRALLNAAVARRQDPRKLVELASELQAYPEATWTDRLVFLDLLHATQDPQFFAYLTELEQKAGEDPGSLGALLSWMTRSRLNLLALDYAKTLPIELLQKWPVPVALADVFVQLNQWQELEAMTAKAQWNRFDFLRHAYLARALREQGKSAAAEHEWAIAAKQASEQSDFLTVLVQTASEWKWENESTDLLWSLSKRPEKQKEAFLALYRNYAKSADTQGLYRVLARLSELDATNLDVQNNRAQVSLLLDANPSEARRLAADVYNKSPKNPAYITTFAYSLLTQGNAKEAVRIMSSLSAEQLGEPTISAYYGICLAAAGDEKARSYLDFGKQANLLPEEKALVDKAYASLDSRSRSR
jgi:thioredoxin-like negative regulator of GroEL